MKKIVLFLAVYLFNTIIAFCQNKTVTEYYNKEWNKVNSKGKASYYRIIEYTGKDIGKYTDYFISGKVQSTGFFSSIKEEIKDSLNIYYSETGEKVSEVNYKNGKYQGVYTSYHENGNKESEIFYVNGEVNGICRTWYESGQLKNRLKKITIVENQNPLTILEGTAVAYYKNGKVKRQAYFKNNVEVLQKCFTENGDSIKCNTPFFSMPTFEGGNEELKRFIISILKYPENSRNSNIHGKVFVSFVVDKDGSIIDIKILKGINEELNEEAIRVVKNMPKWNPGYDDGEIAKFKFTLPIAFTLVP